MTCALCGGLVLWQGLLSALTHTKCQSCGETNCQTLDSEADATREDRDEDADLED